MTDLIFQSFKDWEDGTLRRFTTPNMGIPVNVFFDQVEVCLEYPGEACSYMLGGFGHDIAVYADEAAFERSGKHMTARGLIPIGTFPDPDTGEETPDILFTGVVTHLETDPDAPEDEPDCSAEVETADFTFRLLFRTEDEIKPGNVLYGFAWLFG